MVEILSRILPMQLRMRLADLRGRGVYSNYADQYKCIFIHIPKAAGTSVTQALFGPISRHVPYFEYEQANPRKFREYFKFTFVRNPWDRLLSAYIFLKKGGLNQMDKAWAEANIARYDTFEQFVTQWVNEENIWSWVHFMPQHYFICDGELNLKMDFVGRFETLARDFPHVQQQLGLAATPLPHINQTSGRDSYLDHYSDQVIDIVARVYRDDIRLFSYDFN